MNVNELIAESMGYEYCILFPCARDAMRAYPGVITLPENICPEVFDALPAVTVRPINQKTGLAEDIPVHLYGFQADNSTLHDLAIDPLMTGWLRPLRAKSAIISFGRKKLLSINYGGAFLTNDSNLAEYMRKVTHWNDSFGYILRARLEHLDETIEKRFHTIDLWDRHLGDLLTRVKKEQIMPWRVMRLAFSWAERDQIVSALRAHKLPVGTNFAPLTGQNEWGNTVLNFFCDPSVKVEDIARTRRILERVLL